MKPEEKQLLLDLSLKVQKLTDMALKFHNLNDLFYRMSQIDKFLLTKKLVLLNSDIEFQGTTGTKLGKTTDKMGFYGVTPVVKPTALTTKLTDITYTAPSTPDYAVQDLTQTTPYGFATKDEGNTVLSVIKNLQTRVQELEDKLQALGLVA